MFSYFLNKRAECIRRYTSQRKKLSPAFSDLISKDFMFFTNFTETVFSQKILGGNVAKGSKQQRTFINILIEK